MVHGAGRGLEAGIERAQGLQVVAEELGADGLRGVGRPHVQHTAAHRELRWCGHFGHPLVSGGEKPFEYLRERKVLSAEGQAGRRGGDGRGRRHGIAKGGDWRDDHERVRTQHVGVQRGDGLQAGRHRRAVVLQRGRKLQDADDAFLLEHMQVFRQHVRFRQAGRDSQHERQAIFP